MDTTAATTATFADHAHLATCSTWPDRDHTGCPSSIECHAVTLADLPATEQPRPVVGEKALEETIAPHAERLGLRYWRPSRTSDKRDDIQSFNVGPRNAEIIAEILADAGYHVFGANHYVIHLIP